MKTTGKSMVCAFLVLLLTSLLVAGCSPGKQVIKVGSKEYTEQLVLGQITLLALENAGYAVEDKTGVAGSNKVRTALISKEIDI